MADDWKVVRRKWRLKYKLYERSSMVGGLGFLRQGRIFSIDAKVGMLKGIAEKKSRKMEIKCLRRIVEGAYDGSDRA